MKRKTKKRPKTNRMKERKEGKVTENRKQRPNDTKK